jgi:hypothetical protein
MAMATALARHQAEVRLRFGQLLLLLCTFLAVLFRFLSIGLPAPVFDWPRCLPFPHTGSKPSGNQGPDTSGMAGSVDQSNVIGTNGTLPGVVSTGIALPLFSRFHADKTFMPSGCSLASFPVAMTSQASQHLTKELLLSFLQAMATNHRSLCRKAPAPKSPGFRTLASRTTTALCPNPRLMQTMIHKEGFCLLLLNNLFVWRAVSDFTIAMIRL